MHFVQSVSSGSYAIIRLVLTVAGKSKRAVAAFITLLTLVSIQPTIYPLTQGSLSRFSLTAPSDT